MAFNHYFDYCFYINRCNKLEIGCPFLLVNRTIYMKMMQKNGIKQEKSLVVSNKISKGDKYIPQQKKRLNNKMEI